MANSSGKDTKQQCQQYNKLDMADRYEEWKQQQYRKLILRYLHMLTCGGKKYGLWNNEFVDCGSLY